MLITPLTVSAARDSGLSKQLLFNPPLDHGIVIEVQPEKVEETIPEMIVRIAQEHWVNPNIALSIAKSESGYGQYAKYWYWQNHWMVNERICVPLPTWSCSSAAWIFQFINSTWDSSSKRYGYEWASKYDAEANISVAIKKMSNEWMSAWNASRHIRWN